MSEIGIEGGSEVCALCPEDDPMEDWEDWGEDWDVASDESRCPADVTRV
jgi:hypothetical protein